MKQTNPTTPPTQVQQKKLLKLTILVNRVLNLNPITQVQQKKILKLTILVKYSTKL